MNPAAARSHTDAAGLRQLLRRDALMSDGNNNHGDDSGNQHGNDNENGGDE